MDQETVLILQILQRLGDRRPALSASRRDTCLENVQMKKSRETAQAVVGEEEVEVEAGLASSVEKKDICLESVRTQALVVVVVEEEIDPL